MNTEERRKPQLCKYCNSHLIYLEQRDTGLWWIGCTACRAYYPEEKIKGRRESDKEKILEGETQGSK
jgi:hypothetical protein